MLKQLPADIDQMSRSINEYAKDIRNIYVTVARELRFVNSVVHDNGDVCETTCVTLDGTKYYFNGQQSRDNNLLPDKV